MLKIDLHIHTSERSGCGQSREEEQIHTAINFGLDAVVFSDHGRLVPLARLKELNAKYAPFQIFNGIEITADHEDFIILGVDDPELETAVWSYPDLHSFVRKRDGYIILAHPFRYRPEIIAPVEAFPPDAIELRSVNTPPEAQSRIRETALKLSAKLVCNSDSHSTETIGSHYNILDGQAADAAGLISLLRFSNVRWGGVGYGAD